MPEEILDVENRTYEAEKERLLAEHENKFVLIHQNHVEGVYESQSDAINEGYRMLGNVPFFVKKIERIETPVNFVSFSLAV